MLNENFDRPTEFFYSYSQTLLGWRKGIVVVDDDFQIIGELYLTPAQC